MIALCSTGNVFGVLVGVDVAVGVSVGVGVEVAVNVAVGVAVDVGVGVVVEVALDVGVGVAKGGMLSLQEVQKITTIMLMMKILFLISFIYLLVFSISFALPCRRGCDGEGMPFSNSGTSATAFPWCASFLPFYHTPISSPISFS
jgi:hypothetical protein